MADIGHRLEWNGEEAIRRVSDGFGRNLHIAVKFALGKVRRNLKLKQNRDGKNPSSSTEYPAEVTSMLAKNVTEWIDKVQLRGFIGTNVAYGKHLELKGIKGSPGGRRWLGRTLEEETAGIKARLEKKVL